MIEDRLRGMLRRGFRKGAIEVAFPSGRVEVFGDGSAPGIRARLATAADARAIWLDPELQFAERYMEGGLVLERGGLYDFLALGKRNGSKGFVSLPAAARALGRAIHRKLRRHVLPERAQRNVAHHYDLDGRLFRLFLDEDMQYSCAYFPEGGETLEAAQRAKKRHLAAKLRIAPGMRALDIGSGWGGLGLYLARATGADVTGVTLSEEQHRVSNARAAEAGFADRARFLLQDYRKVEGRFDRIVSVGMFEHVGPQHFAEYFRQIERLLAPDGIALVHSIQRRRPNAYDPPFVEKYIFPNGHIPTLGETFPAVERTKLMVKDVEILTMHYADTIREWRARAEAKRAEIVALYDERFYRMWDLYLCSSEVSFRFGNLANFQVLLTKRHAEAPRARGWIEAEEARLAAAGF